jgi:hypothetical protein
MMGLVRRKGWFKATSLTRRRVQVAVEGRLVPPPRPRRLYHVSGAVAAQAVRLDRRRDALCSLLARAAGAASFGRLAAGLDSAMGIADGAGGGDGLGDL